EISHKHSNTPLLAPHRGHYSTPARAMRTCRNVSGGNPCDPGNGPLRGSGGGYVGDAPSDTRAVETRTVGTRTVGAGVNASLEPKPKVRKSRSSAPQM